ncbi:MAG: TIGR03943 family putative permease subunit [Candidatus Gracilibacteria bacterium]
MIHLYIRYIAGLLLILFGGIILYLQNADKLGFYVYPTHIIYISLSAFVLILTGVFIIFVKRGIHFHLENTYLLPVLFIPILLVLFFPSKPLSSDAALARGVVEDLPVFAADTSFSFNVDPKNRQILDWIKAFNADPEPNSYVGQEVDIQGFVVPSEIPNTFFITRFYIACCAADARPIAIPVEYSGDFTPAKDDWLEIERIMKSGIINGERKVVIEMKKSTPIPVPSNPYAF